MLPTPATKGAKVRTMGTKRASTTVLPPYLHQMKRRPHQARLTPPNTSEEQGDGGGGAEVLWLGTDFSSTS